jgi:NADH:ubiquinone oxidoreductase subunit 3 (subunit A)
MVLTIFDLCVTVLLAIHTIYIQVGIIRITLPANTILSLIMQESRILAMKKRLGLVFLIAFIAIALGFSIPFLPWIKPEITEGAKVITFDEGHCAVETESMNIIQVDNCNKNVGDRVTVKYREMTSVGELIP